MGVLMSEEVRRERADDLAASYATDRVLGDVASFTEWVSDQCIGRSRVELGYVPSDEVELQARIDAADVPTLVALQLYPTTAARAMASDEIRARWLKHCEHRISRLAAELAPAVAEDLQ